MYRGRYLHLGLLVGTLALAGWCCRVARADVPGWQEKSFNEGIAGSAKESGGVITIQGSGNDTWERNDGFHIVYKPLKGDGSVTTQLLSADEGSEWSKIGVMMRNDLTSVSAPVLENHMTTGHGGEPIVRYIDDTPMGKDNMFTINGGADLFPRDFPLFLKIERRNNVFTSYYSKKGDFWTPVTRANRIPMQDEIVAGIFVCSHDDSTLLQGTFDTKSTDVSNTLLKPEQAAPVQPDPVLVTSGDNSVMLTWDRVNHLGQDADGYAVYKSPVTSGSYDDLKFEKVADLPGDKTSFLDDKIKNGELAVYQVRTVVKIGGNTVESQSINGRMIYVAGAANPPIQIGNAAYQVAVLDGKGEGDITSNPGSAVVDSNGVLTMRASGSDFWERGDGGTAVLTKVAGNFTLTARLNGPPQGEGGDASEWSKSGPMIRDNTMGESRSFGIYATGQHGLQAIRRAYETGRGEDIGTTGADQVYPIYVRIQRQDDKLNLFTSKDGTTFVPYAKEDGTPAPSTTMQGLNKEVLVGFGTSATDNSAIVSMKIDNIKLEATP